MLLGIDLGTTGVKAIVFDENANIMGESFKSYDISYGTGTKAVQDAKYLFACTKYVIKEAVREGKTTVRALSVSVQGDAVIAIDENRCAITDAQLGMDYRGQDESDMCEEMFGAQWLFEQTGMRPHPMNSLIKILWIQKHEPHIFEKAYKFVTYADYILGKLGSDEMVIDYTMAGRTMAFDLKHMRWHREILEKLAIPKEKLSTPVPSGTIVGTISQELVEELGLSKDVVLVAGGHDQTCAALGAGVIKEEMALDSHGTAEVLSAVLKAPVLNESMYRGFYPCYPHVLPHMYFTFGLNHTSGVLLKWFVEQFCQKEIDDAEKTKSSVYEQLMQKLPAAPAKVMMLPYLNGRGNPVCDTAMKGAFFGLTMDTKKEDLAKAVLEAQAFEMRLNMEALEGNNIAIRELRCVGGGAKSPKGLQLKADIWGTNVASLCVREAACLGAALLAGVAIKIFKDANEAARCIKTAQIYTPDMAKQTQYEERFSIYRELYQTIKSTMYQL